MNDVTRILSAIDQGDPQAAERLLPLVYDELRKLAAQRLAHEKPGQTLQATALVHEAYLRLVGPSEASSGTAEATSSPPPPKRCDVYWSTRPGGRTALVTAGDGSDRSCSKATLTTEPVSDDLLDLDEALTRFSQIDSQAAELVQLRVFAGMTVEEAARHLGVSPRTAKRSWAYARAWLMRELSPAPESDRE